jgi:hypothetical protein
VKPSLAKQEWLKRRKSHWKVPFRQVYCDSFKSMVMDTIWCHVVLKLFPYADNPVPCPDGKHHMAPRPVCDYCGARPYYDRAEVQ